MATKKVSKVKKTKEVTQIGSKGNVYVYSSYNNTVVSLTDLNGNVVAWSSAGKCGFKGPKKATAYAAQMVVKDIITKIDGRGLREVSIFVRGIGAGRESAIRALNANGLLITLIKDVTPMPHNGCRPKKPRRV